MKKKIILNEILNAENGTVVLRAESDSMNAILAPENHQKQTAFATFIFSQSH